ncbi:adenylyl-sulfate kinase [Candidatus Nitronereus thalassa]|uniref:Adenylyl-sulfate kinase n=1 Tax=Candidatus Nitronereus thalassa TaxID=3020898 RepID=A0ABU3K547_9BACT|nr:adenylyl-sulfate kinase [Candidatus Nitronereus thalassa]MDT7041530.1 adenylyl-sulfate kinase [Candidatus Nitronereus thalassa]
MRDMKLNSGFTIWLTGLPSSGKSTLSRLVCQSLEEAGLPVVILDGDEIRQRLTKGLGFSKADRDENIRRIAYVAKLLTKVGAIPIVAAISPFHETRDRARTEIGKFVEIYVNCPLQKCIDRDVKGLYAKACRGEIKNFTGVSDPYEPPDNPELVVHTDLDTPEANLKEILECLIGLNYLPEQIIDQVFPGKENPVENKTVQSVASGNWAI